ncbi:hypothetical protein [Vibrio vulnificus]|uniref:hypothetical protein n=1 Tax=Vibrio vulnificus TaxID=672 RepID=UPI0002E3FC14|nr:hypothetical protein [Vibrio vulnificus]ASM96364.1 hypothetical protein AOT11_14305 [Vibrio vulnificus NBRC 15645 = ATCC 27562]MCL7019411.1 hypothetical protein [Vibrio vulnificus]MDK2700983.1 hypothetical protein [Vibrio vulnificus]QET74907.1 hypothetical protein FOB71_07625 [Vibrio vulnificus]SUP56849.1 acid phosphatase [Vibrio vulnificus]
MKKVSLLAASVAIALTGCGGSDSGSGSNDNVAPGGVIVTGFDGYFNQAVVFLDKNNNGKLDIGSDTIFGLTDKEGRRTIPSDTQGVLALQTLTPGGTVQTALANHAPETYAGKYTIDMDHPTQAMAHEVVFRAPSKSTVISPLSDLVAIEMASGASEEEAILKVSTALGGTPEQPIKLLSNFIDGADKNVSLHKTAQILTESKAANPGSYEKKATQFAEQAGKIVGDLTEEQVKEVNYKPVIKDTAPNEDTLVPTEVINNKLTVSESAQSRVQHSLNALTIVQDEHFTTAHISIANLFDDPDQASLAVITSGESTFDEAGLIATFSGSDLVLSANTAGIIKAGVFTIILQSQDKAADGSQVGSPVSTKFTLKVDSANLAPIVDKEVEARIQREIDGWQLQEGELFSQTISLTPLFTDTDGEIKSTKVGLGGVVDGLSSNTDLDNLIVTISGTPKMEWNQKGKITLQVTDDKNAESETVTFLMPEVKAGVMPPPEAHPLEGKTWYRLEHGSGTPEEKLPYSRIWCDTLHFENGKVSGNYRTMSNLTQCGELAENSWSNGTYRVQGNQVIAKFGDDPDATLTITDADDIAPGAKILFWTSNEGTERYTLFSNKSDAEARIQIRSDDGPEQRFFNMPLPTEVDGVEALGMVSLSLRRNNNPDDEGAMDANLTLEFPDQNFTCKDAEEFYENFIITGPGLVTETTDYNTGIIHKSYGVYSGNEWGTSLECYDKTDDNGIDHAGIDFDLPELTIGGVYSFIGKVKAQQGEYIEAVKFNMTWTGAGNNE